MRSRAVPTTVHITVRAEGVIGSLKRSALRQLNLPGMGPSVRTMQLRRSEERNCPTLANGILLDLGQRCPNLRTLSMQNVLPESSSPQPRDDPDKPAFRSLVTLHVYPSRAQILRGSTEALLHLFLHMPCLLDLTLWGPADSPLFDCEDAKQITTMPTPPFRLEAFRYGGVISLSGAIQIILASSRTLRELELTARWAPAGAPEGALVAALVHVAPRLTHFYVLVRTESSSALFEPVFAALRHLHHLFIEAPSQALMGTTARLVSRAPERLPLHVIALQYAGDVSTHDEVDWARLVTDLPQFQRMRHLEWGPAPDTAAERQELIDRNRNSI
ncbi:hypothetical protein AURDEDRAFT_175679 [Auricularia subglabra TFB-10046 SS5]|uniref:F-box domain-containing protein n=1 Tax=Auricularia subglabra (strain TFB-10046 / SS5) TaxID=717982 RepID=J0WRD2_AURST|nr:hypothetical protein AURDEDRAFT_175679 [Auricularia subglabra TFB-10046 SS5]